MVGRSFKAKRNKFQHVAADVDEMRFRFNFTAKDQWTMGRSRKGGFDNWKVGGQ